TNLMSATPRLLSGDNPPDLIRLPSMVSLVKDALLMNLDDYVTAFGWDKFPAAQLAQNRVASDGTRGSGSLYAAGLNYSLTGYFPKDVNAIEYTDANARFGKGQGVFMFNGDWQNAVYDKDMSSNVGFFVFPPGEASGSLAAMSAPLTYGISAKAKNADCAAFFFNWVATNDKARQIDVAVGGSNPGGPPDLSLPKATAAVTNETLAAGADV